jgi:hypothetical protein
MPFKAMNLKKMGRDEEKAFDFGSRDLAVEVKSNF